MAYFTHYWEAETCHRHDDSGDYLLEGIAGNQFLRRGVAPGDTVYIVNVLGGRLRLLSRITIDKIVSEQEAKKKFGDDVYPGKDQCLGKPGHSTPVSVSRYVPADVVRRLSFVNSKGKEVPPKFRDADSESLDGQTLRGVRQLTEGSAKLLDSAL